MREIVPSPDTMRSLEEAARRYHLDLMESDEGLDYLTGQRGLTLDTLRYFNLGIVSDPMPEHHQFRGKLCVPYWTVSGIVSLRFKTIPDANGNMGGPKMLSMEGAFGLARPYNVTDVLSTDQRLILTEGEPDTWTMKQLGYRVVGIQNATAWKPEYGPMFQYRRELLIIVHGDENGAGQKLATRISKDVPYLKQIVMPTGHDANSYFTQYGEDSLRFLLGD